MVALLSLPACDIGMYHKTYVSPNRMQVRETEYFEKVPIEAINADYLDAAAVTYSQTGRGPFEIAVVYDPQSKTNTAMHAARKAKLIAEQLHASGVMDIDAGILPVYAQGEDSYALLSYDSYTALPPENCTLMAGMENTEIEADPNYKLGCSVNTILAKQIARPKDLAGQVDKNTTSDGRRAARIVGIYRSGSKDSKLEGESASGN